jgi:hypothetical protein
VIVVIGWTILRESEMHTRTLLLLTLGLPAIANLEASTPGIAEEFARALVSSGRSPEITADEDLYAGLIGIWDVDVRDRLDDGSFRTSRGEWLFVRTLEGRAVQDVWVSPPRAERRPNGDKSVNRYGTTIRTFDPRTRRWQATFLNPVSGAFDVLIGRREGRSIVQEGTRPSGQRMRWVFSDITDRSFHWTGEALQSDGSWQLEAEFFGHRRR